MKRKFMTKIAILGALAAFLSGCATYIPFRIVGLDEAPPTAEPDAVRPADRPAPAVSGTVVYDTELLRVTKQREGTGLASVGQEAAYRILVLAKKPVTNVKVEEQFPSSIKYVSSTPAGTVAEDKVRWDLGTMAEGETKTIRVRATPQERGTFSVCSVVTADPLICVPIVVGAPDLRIVKSGPPTAEVGDTVTWNVTVTNTGDAPALNVRITDTLPEHFTAGTPVSFDAGTLEPGQSRSVQVAARAGRTGSYTNRASAVRAGADPISATAPIRIVQSGIDVEKTGAERAYALVDERFTIKVTNSGDTTLENVQVVDQLPANVRVSDAGGGTVSGNTITWNVGRLAAGASRSFNIVMTSTQPGRTVNTAIATAERGLRDTDTHETEWRAVPGIQTTIVDDVDPIRVGQRVVYTLRVANQSPLEPVSATVNVRFPPEVRPVSVVEGPVRGAVSDRTVRFDNVNLRPGQEIVLRINAEGARSGYGTVIMETTTGFRETPVVDQESTTVY